MHLSLLDKKKTNKISKSLLERIIEIMEKMITNKYFRIRDRYNETSKEIIGKLSLYNQVVIVRRRRKAGKKLKEMKMRIALLMLMVVGEIKMALNHNKINGRMKMKKIKIIWYYKT